MSKKDSIQGLLNRNNSRPNNDNAAKQELTGNTDVHTDVQENINTARTIKKATFELDSELHHWLKLYSVQHGKKMVEVVEEALLAYKEANDK